MRLTLVFKGGKGSGHHGHVGRPGQIGGSTSGVGTDPLPEGWQRGTDDVIWQAVGNSRVEVGSGKKGWYYQPREKGLHAASLRRDGFSDRDDAVRASADWLRLCGPMRWKVYYSGKDLKMKSTTISAKDEYAAQQKVELGKKNFWRHDRVERPRH